MCTSKAACHTTDLTGLFMDATNPPALVLHSIYMVDPQIFYCYFEFIMIFYNCTSPFAICTESRAGEIGNFPAGQQLKIEATVL